MIQLLSEYPLLLLFVVVSLGYLIGSIQVKGSSLGVAAILFTGLAFGAADDRLQIPAIIFQLGLSVYVYSVGLSSGPAFFKSYQKNGPRDFLFSLSMLILTGIIAGVLWLILDFTPATITGIYTGSTTNTAALAAVLDNINQVFDAHQAEIPMSEAVVGYSYSYPMGVLGGMIAIVMMERWLKINYADEAHKLRKDYPLGEKIEKITIEVTSPEVCNQQLRYLLKEYDLDVSFGRIYREGNTELINYHSTFQMGDQLMVIGNEEELQKTIHIFGKKMDSDLSNDRRIFDVRRIFLSNSDLAGRSIASLNLDAKYDAIITRIRRGDIDMLAKPETVLELGDRIRFIARRDELDELSTFFGDSYRESSRVNLFSFGLGIGLGLVLGSIEFNFSETLQFKLGYAGGPLIMGLILGALRRTGPVSWTLPYSANVTLQQIGLILLLTAIGVRSGNAFVASFTADGIWIFLASAVLSLLTAFAILFIGYKWIKIPFSLLMGMVANQPAILDFATSRSKNRIPEYGFTTMFPIALIMKIVIAQLLFWILS